MGLRNNNKLKRRKGERNSVPLYKKITSYRPFFQLDCRMTQHLIHEQRFKANPIVIGDVGARSGFGPLWDIFAEQGLLVGFEPDKDESDKLKSDYSPRKRKGLPSVRIVNSALWEYDGIIPLYITMDPNSSSCFPPNYDFLNRLPDSSQAEVTRVAKVKTTTLDVYCEDNKICFDLLKLDVQGGELSILKGAVNQLQNSVLAIIAEVEFVPLYRKQPLFADVDQFLRAQGFALFDLDIRRWRRKPLPNKFDGIRIGQAIYADALYLWDPFGEKERRAKSHPKVQKLLKLALFAECFSLPDYAIEILSLARNKNLIDASVKEQLIDLLYSNEIVDRYDRNKM